MDPLPPFVVSLRRIGSRLVRFAVPIAKGGRPAVTGSKDRDETANVEDGSFLGKEICFRDLPSLPCWILQR